MTQRQSQRKAILASCFGTAMEYYDYSLFGIYSAIVFNKIFFDPADPAAGTLQAMAIFSIGFLFRPVGGMILASLGDRFGRRLALVVTLIMMGTSTFLIGVLPTYQQVGILAPLLLLLLRFVQAAGAGTELNAAVVFIAEGTTSRSKGLIASLPTMGTFIGSVLASLSVSLVSLLPEDDFLSWGWRIPFLASAIVVVVGVMLRYRLDETKEFVAMVEHNAVSRQPIRESLRTDRKAILTVFVAVAGWMPFPFLFQVYALSYADSVLHLPGPVITVGLLISALVAIPCLPLFGALSDRVGRKRVIVSGYLFLALFTGPFFLLAATGNGWGFWLAMAIGFGVGNSALFAPQQAWLVDMFDVRRRLSGMVLGREVGGAAGGLTPLIASALVIAANGSPRFLMVFLISSALVGALAVAVSKPHRQEPTVQADDMAEPTVAKPAVPLV